MSDIVYIIDRNKYGEEEILSQDRIFLHSEESEHIDETWKVNRDRFFKYQSKDSK